VGRLADTWARPGALEHALGELSLAPRALSRRCDVRCPWCGERSAWVARPRAEEAPVVRCNRRNRCGRSAPLWGLLTERLGREGAQDLVNRLAVDDAPSSTPRALPEPDHAPAPRIPPGEIERLWDGAEILEPARPDHADVVRLLEAKGTDPRDVLGSIARVLPRTVSAPWWRSAWSRSHRLAVRLFDSVGRPAAIQARRTEGHLSEEPRQRMPLTLGRYSFGGLFMLEPAALAWVRREIEIEEIAIAEGLTDWIRLASSPLAAELRLAAIGMVNGSQGAIADLPWRRGMTVRVLTDLDPAGERYATMIAARIPAGVRIIRG
jgi:hypothetical protein